MNAPNTSYLCRVLVNPKGYQYVCTPNGTKLPLQVCSTVSQSTENAIQGIVWVEVEVLYEPEVYSILDGILLFCGDRLPGVRSALFLTDPDSKQDKIKISLKCVAGATEQKPVNLQALVAP